MKKEQFTYQSKDQQTRIHAVRWIPEGEVRAVLQISHGMVEFIERYHDFATYLAGHGILVTGNDHLGHGKSVVSEDAYGFFAEKDGNAAVLDDIHRLRILTQKKWPDVPYFVMGHSMGSFLIRQYLYLHGEGLAGAIVMGTGSTPRIVTIGAMTMTRMLAKVKGWKYRSQFINGLAFGAYNKKFGKPDGKDWLSRNEENVREYLAEPLCNFIFTLNGYYNLFYSLNCLCDKKKLEQMPADIPVLMVSGEDDPVGHFGEGVKTAAKQMKDAGVKNIVVKLYPNDRHEILKEDDRRDVYSDIRNWMEKNIVY